jgi:hypothetical protein
MIIKYFYSAGQRLENIEIDKCCNLFGLFVSDEEKKRFYGIDTRSWLAWRSLASGLSVSPWRVNETMKLSPSFDLSDIVGLVSSAESDASTVEDYELKDCLH